MGNVGFWMLLWFDCLLWVPQLYGSFSKSLDVPFRCCIMDQLWGIICRSSLVSFLFAIICSYYKKILSPHFLSCYFIFGSLCQMITALLLSQPLLFVALLCYSFRFEVHSTLALSLKSLGIKASAKCLNVKCEMSHNGEVQLWNHQLCAQRSVGTVCLLACVGVYMQLYMRGRLTVHSQRAESAPCPFPCHTHSYTRRWSQYSGPGSSPGHTHTSV